MAILEVKNLRSKYSASGPEILKGISFEVEENDFFAIKKCDVLLAHLGDPQSPGVQMELGIALTLKKRIIVLTEQGTQKPYLVKGLSGIVNVQYVEFNSDIDLYEQLDQIL